MILCICALKSVLLVISTTLEFKNNKGICMKDTEYYLI